MISLETKRLILRDYQEADLQVYYKLKSDPKTMYYLQDIMLRSRQEAEEDFARVLSDQKSRERQFYFLHMERKEDGEQIGSIGYTVLLTYRLGSWFIWVILRIRSFGDRVIRQRL